MKLYEDKNLIVFEKPSGIATLKEGNIKEAFEDIILESYSYLKKIERSGIVHRLDKETSGTLLVAKSSELLLFFQKQFKNREVEKEYIALVCGNVKENKGEINTLIGRSPSNYKKQKAYSLISFEKENKREAITKYKVLERFNSYTLLKVSPKTGRKHQIRCHFAYLGYPVVGDNLYGFKGQKNLVGLSRLFLHSSLIKIKMPSKKIVEFYSSLPKELEKVLENLRSNFILQN